MGRPPQWINRSRRPYLALTEVTRIFKNEKIKMGFRRIMSLVDANRWKPTQAFCGSGVGKSTLLHEAFTLKRHYCAGLIRERVEKFWSIEKDLGEKGDTKKSCRLCDIGNIHSCSFERRVSSDDDCGIFSWPRGKKWSNEIPYGRCLWPKER